MYYHKIQSGQSAKLQNHSVLPFFRQVSIPAPVGAVLRRKVPRTLTARQHAHSVLIHAICTFLTAPDPQQKGAKPHNSLKLNYSALGLIVSMKYVILHIR